VAENLLGLTLTLVGRFPNPVPSGIRVPHWALLDVTNENLWDFNKSYAAGDSPELAPGSTPGPSSPSSPSSKVATIAAVVLGGIVATCLLVAALLFYRRRRRSLASSVARPAPESAGDSQPVGGFVAFNTPMLSQIPSRTSSDRNLYTVSPMPAP
jgi:hypothetical protein